MRLAIPAYQHGVGTRVILGVIFIIVGLGEVVKVNLWPMLLIAIGFVMIGAFFLYPPTVITRRLRSGSSLRGYHVEPRRPQFEPVLVQGPVCRQIAKAGLHKQLAQLPIGIHPH